MAVKHVNALDISFFLSSLLSLTSSICVFHIHTLSVGAFATHRTPFRDNDEERGGGERVPKKSKRDRQIRRAPS